MSIIRHQDILIGRPELLPGPQAKAARAQIDAIQRDKAHPWHRGDPNAVEHVNRLYLTAYGDRVVAKT